jgi:Reverse transcriptase (RNA-dependent DNA polymerase)
LSSSPNFNEFQSAYKKHLSTETALLKVTDDIFAHFADHEATILVALDESAAFDCIDHQTLICRLNHSFGLTGKALGWFSLYLESRSTFVRWKQVSSSSCSIVRNRRSTRLSFRTSPFLIVPETFGLSERIIMRKTHKFTHDTLQYEYTTYAS